MASKAIKGYKFVFGGKSRPGIVGDKPKSGGVIDEFKSRKLKQLGRTQRKLKSQDKEMGEAIKGAQKKGLSRKDAVKGRKFQRDSRRAQREGDKLRKDVLRAGRKDGGMAGPMKPRDKRKPMKSGDEGPKRKLKPVQPDQKGLQKLPTKLQIYITILLEKNTLQYLQIKTLGFSQISNHPQLPLDPEHHVKKISIKRSSYIA